MYHQEQHLLHQHDPAATAQQLSNLISQHLFNLNNAPHAHNKRRVKQLLHSLRLSTSSRDPTCIKNQQRAYPKTKGRM
jgi:hypothetical protein